MRNNYDIRSKAIDDARSLREVGEILGMSHANVAKIQDKALRKIAAHVLNEVRGEGEWTERDLRFLSTSAALVDAIKRCIRGEGVRNN